GSLPNAALTPDSAGNLYGTAEYGGAHKQGVVFSLTPGGQETVLHAFKGGRNDGGKPVAAIVFDSIGNLYGTTWDGGPDGNGTVFRLAPDGSETGLFAFSGGSNGANPGAKVLLQGGYLYGTTTYGGDNGCGGGTGCGVAFMLTTDGKETVLHAFHGGSDGSMP